MSENTGKVYTGYIAEISAVSVFIHANGERWPVTINILKKYGDPALYDGGFKVG